MDAPSFAGEPTIANAMSIHLAGRAIKDYDLLLISDRLLESLLLFALTVRPIDMMGQFGDPIHLPKLNCAADRKKTAQLSQIVRDKFVE